MTIVSVMTVQGIFLGCLGGGGGGGGLYLISDSAAEKCCPLQCYWLLYNV